jgi:hypothetical protein
MKISKNIILIILTFCAIQVQSQSFTGGIIAGFTTSQVNGDNLGGFYKFGATGGAFVERKFNTKTSGIFELRFTQKGSGDGKGLMKINLGYVEIPFLVKIQSYQRIAFKFGIAPSFKIFESTYVNTYESATSNFWKWDAPIHIGADYRITDKLLFDVRYSMSTYPISHKYSNLCVYFALHKIITN